MAFRTIIASMALAAVSSAATINGKEIDCPDGWSGGSVNDGDVYCCFGSSHIINNKGSCCVGGSAVVPEFDDCFPFCDETDSGSNEVSIPTQSCATEIPYTAKDYSSLVSEASRSVMSEASSTSGGDKTGSPASNSAEPTKSDSSDDDDDDDDDDSDNGNGTNNSSGGNGDSSNSNNDDDDSDSDDASDSDNAGPLPTGNVVAQFGGAVAAAALLAL